MKNYPNHIDSLDTFLYKGERVSKTHPLIEAVGVIDELNSYLGIIRSSMTLEDVREVLGQVQNDLFIIGSDLANPSKDQTMLSQTHAIKTHELTEERIKDMERMIMQFEREVPPLKNFILPSGSKNAAHLQYARALARKAERRLIAVEKNINIKIQAYLNRMSDFLFMVARYVNMKEGGVEEMWQKP